MFTYSFFFLLCHWTEKYSASWPVALLFGAETLDTQRARGWLGLRSCMESENYTSVYYSGRESNSNFSSSNSSPVTFLQA